MKQMEYFLFWSRRIFFVWFLRPKNPKSVVKHPSYGALHTYIHTYIHTDKVTWLFFSAYAIKIEKQAYQLAAKG